MRHDLSHDRYEKDSIKSVENDIKKFNNILYYLVPLTSNFGTEVTINKKTIVLTDKYWSWYDKFSKLIKTNMSKESYSYLQKLEKEENWQELNIFIRILYL